MSDHAEAVADGAALDLEGLRANPEARGLADAYVLLDRIAGVHRDAVPGTKREGDRGRAGTRGRVRPDARPDFRWGPLLVYERIGAGSFGDVYRAVDPRLDLEVALKLSRPGGQTEPGNARRFLDEARRLARLRHPNIVTVLGAEVDRGRTGFWMERIEGRSLEEALEQEGPCAEPQAIEIGLALCSALGALHEEGWIHGDVKTANVLRDREGRVVLVDFGTAVEIQGSQAGRNGPAYLDTGTPVSLAPEIVAGKPAGVASDIYALGTVLFRVLSGHDRVHGTTFEEISRSHRDRRYRQLADLRSDLSVRLRSVIARALARDPDRRFESASSLAEALEACRKPSGNLPASAGELIGRDREVAEIAALVEAHRLTTLTGVGGVGKTRLALAAAASVASRFVDGVWFLDLGEARDVPRAEAMLAGTMGITERADRPLYRTLVEHLETTQTFLVLDGCEHLVPSVAEWVDALLRDCPRMRVLATSRENLEGPEEAIYRTSGLTLAEPGKAESANEAENTDGIVFFRSRARAANSQLDLGPHTLALEIEICIGLDGIPLALELAAARLSTYGLVDLRDGLTRRLDSLGARTRPDRHRTLRATVDWSHDLLGRAEQRVFRRLAVLADGWTLRDASLVAADSAPETDDGSRSSTNVGVDATADLILELVRKSMVEKYDGDSLSTSRYRLLETLRQYASERLAAAGEVESMQRKQARHYASLAASARDAVRGGDAETGVKRLVEEAPNLRRALRFHLDHPGVEAEVEATVELVNALSHLWFPEGLLSEARETYRTLLDRFSVGRSAAWAGVLLGAGVEAWERGDLTAAVQRTEWSLDIYRELGADRGVSLAIGNLALVAFDRGDHARCRSLLEESLILAREREDEVAAGDALLNLAALELELGRLEDAERFAAEADPILRRTRATQSLCRNLLNRAKLESLRGRPEDALPAAEEALAIARTSFDRTDHACSLLYLGRAHAKRDPERALELLHDAAEVARDLDDWGIQGEIWANLADVEISMGRSDSASYNLRRAVGAIRGKAFRDRGRIVSLVIRTAGEHAARTGRSAEAAWRLKWVAGDSSADAALDRLTRELDVESAV